MTYNFEKLKELNINYLKSWRGKVALAEMLKEIIKPNYQPLPMVRQHKCWSEMDLNLRPWGGMLVVLTAE